MCMYLPQGEGSRCPDASIPGSMLPAIDFTLDNRARY